MSMELPFTYRIRRVGVAGLPVRMAVVVVFRLQARDKQDVVELQFSQQNGVFLKANVRNLALRRRADGCSRIDLSAAGSRPSRKREIAVFRVNFLAARGLIAGGFRSIL